MLDDAAIASAASDAVGKRVLGVRRLGGGISNLTYVVRLDPPTEPVVVRVFEDPERARAQRAALRLLEGSDVPAPRLLGHGRLPGAGPYVVETRVPGRPVARPRGARRIAGLAAALAAIHGLATWTVPPRRPRSRARAGFDAWLLLAALRPLPDPARWLPSCAGAGYAGLTARVLRRRLTALVHSIA